MRTVFLMLLIICVRSQLWLYLVRHELSKLKTNVKSGTVFELKGKQYKAVEVCK